MDSAFLHPFLVRPGGMADYASAFLIQILAWPWWGSALLAGCGGFLSLFSLLYLRAVYARPVSTLHLFPLVFMAGALSNYGQSLAVLVSLLALTGGAAFYACMPFRRSGPRFVVFGVLSVILYWIAGGAALLFVVLCAMLEWAHPGLRLLGAALVGWGFVPPLAAVFLFRCPAAQSLDGAIPALPHSLMGISATALQTFLPAAALAGAVLRSIQKEPAPGPRQSRGRLALVLAKVGALALAGVGTLYITYQPMARSALLADYAGEHRQWDVLLRTVRENGLGGPFVAHDVDRALFHKGRLLDEMFAYPQEATTSPLLLDAYVFQIGRAYMKRSDIFLDLGHVNVSEHMAYEALENVGELPPILERLGIIHVLKKQPEAARIMFRQLAKYPFYRAKAEAYLKAMETDPLLASDPQVAEWRAVMTDASYVIRASLLLVEPVGKSLPSDDGSEPGQLLPILLEANPKNRMAFEYLIAHYLLTLQVDRVMAHLGMFRELGYPALPRHVQEAVLLFVSLSGGRRPNLYGYTIGIENQNRFEAFRKVVSSRAKDTEAILQKDYGDTYWYYFNVQLQNIRREGQARSNEIGAQP